MRILSWRTLVFVAILGVAILDVAIDDKRRFWPAGTASDGNIGIRSFILWPRMVMNNARQIAVSTSSALETTRTSEEGREIRPLGKSIDGLHLRRLQHHPRNGNVASKASRASRALRQQSVNSTAPSCPLDFRGMAKFPWFADVCLNPTMKDPNGNNSCCVALVSALGQAESMYLRDTGKFRLDDVGIVSDCMKDLATELLALDSRIDVAYIIPTCFPQSSLSRFVSSPSNCQGIITKEDYARVVGTTALENTIEACCKESLTGNQNCKSCIDEVVDVIESLTIISPNNSDCFFFSLSYAAGVVNTQGPYSQGTAGCLFAVQAIPGSGRGNKNLPVHIAIGAAVALMAFFVAFVLFFLWYRRRKKAIHRAFLERHARMLKPALSKPNTGLVQFSYVELKAATESFSSKNYLGSGGCGDVYRGMLDDGMEVAIKRMKNCSEDGDGDFVNELTVINSVRHRHLSILRGYCITSSDSDGHQRLLIYDYMPNGSLYDYLFRPGNPVLSWPDRRRIAVEIAKGISYLHTGTRSPIIHRDIKSSNVLLDEHLNAKVADFGLAMFSNEGNSHSKAGGTLGYIAPEYVIYGQLTELSDVYSFGVVLLELISGRKALEGLEKGENATLITDWAWKKAKEDKDGSLMGIVDERIRGTGTSEIMERFVLVGFLCAHMLVALRPTMEEAIKYLEGDVGIPQVPNRPLPLNFDASTDESFVAAPVPAPYVTSSRHSTIERDVISDADPNNFSSSWDDGSESSRRVRDEHVLAMGEFSGCSAEVQSCELLR